MHSLLAQPNVCFSNYCVILVLRFSKDALTLYNSREMVSDILKTFSIKICYTFRRKCDTVYSKCTVSGVETIATIFNPNLINLLLAKYY